MGRDAGAVVGENSCPPPEILAIYLARESRITSAVFVQRNGFGSSFHALRRDTLVGRSTELDRLVLCKIVS